MAVHVRLMRMGKKKQAYYRIVATDSRRARDGRFLEIIGTYDPITKPAVVNVHEDKLTKWLDQGAQPTDTVKSLLTQVGFIEKYNLAKQGKDVSEIILKTNIVERKKKTRKIKKAALNAAAAKEAEEAEKAKAAEAAIKAEEAKKADEAKKAEAAKKAEEAKAAEAAKASDGEEKSE